MDKQLQETLAQVTMYSKMGRYISNKILKYNKHSKSHRSLRNIQLNKEDYLKLKKQRPDEKLVSQSQHSSSKIRNISCMTQPPVGYYKVNFNQIEKNPRVYNFNRSVPHFNREKFYCQQSKPVVHDYPESSLCQYRVTGFKQLKRMAARCDIKGSIRKQIQDPHEKRFQLTQDFKSIQFRKTKVNMSKDLPRNGAAFATCSNGPEYQYDVKVPLKRLDTHIIPFQRILDRNQNFMVDEKGISNYFADVQLCQQQKMPCWKKMLPRQKTGLLPSYMDKNINTRSSISLLNLKTLQMNCTKLKEPLLKGGDKKRRKMVFMQQSETDKENRDDINI